MVEQMSFADTKPGITGQKIVDDTDKWVQRNYYVYREMVGKALQCARRGKRTSISRLVEEARYTRHIEAADSFKINNTIRASKADWA